MSTPRFVPSMLHPRYWLTWMFFGVWYTLCLLPYRWQLALGRVLGRLYYRFGTRRRGIARCNIDLCFPEQTPQQREMLVKESMISAGMAFLETGISWFWPKSRLQRLYTIDGLEHLHSAERDGQGVILIAVHEAHIDICGKLMGLEFSIDGTYRPHGNPLYDYLQRTGRERHTMQARAIPRDDVRGMAKALRAGRVVWYAPDQDYGARHSIFVPLFGVPAATVTATSQLARMGKARVMGFGQIRKPNGEGYHLRIYPPLANFPSDDEVADCVRINQFVEERICEKPEQYLWVHRRFKTRPPGTPDLYAPYGVGDRKRRSKSG